MSRECSECGESISTKRLQALPDTQLCVSCATRGENPTVRSAPPRPIPLKTPVSTHGLRRYLANVGPKQDGRALFRILVRVCYLFPQISATEMLPIFILWSQRTNAPFDQEQIRQLVLDAKQWVKEHPSERRKTVR